MQPFSVRSLHVGTIDYCSDDSEPIVLVRLAISLEPQLAPLRLHTKAQLLSFSFIFLNQDRVVVQVNVPSKLMQVTGQQPQENVVRFFKQPQLKAMEDALACNLFAWILSPRDAVGKAHCPDREVTLVPVPSH